MPRQLGNARQILADPEFINPQSIRDYSNAGRQILREVSIDLSIGGELLKAVLKEVPVKDSNMPQASRMRAFWIARHIDVAAEEAKSAAAHMAQCYAAFLKHFAPELEAAGVTKAKPKFTI